MISPAVWSNNSLPCLDSPLLISPSVIIPIIRSFSFKTPVTPSPFSEISVNTTLAPNSSNVSTSLFVIDISSSVVNGTFVDFELELSAESGFLRVIPFSIQIGRTTDNDPSGPDEYGYYIYDSNQEM